MKIILHSPAINVTRPIERSMNIAIAPIYRNIVSRTWQVTSLIVFNIRRIG